MGADHRAYAVDDHPPVQTGEAGLHQVGYRPSVLRTGRVAQEALAAVGRAALGVLSHLLDHALDDPALAADLFPGEQAAQMVHVQQRADAQQSPHCRRCGRDAAAPLIAGQVGGEEPVMYLQLVGLQPVGCLLYTSDAADE